MDSLAGINFYRMQINDLKDISARKDKVEEVIKNIQEVCFMISDYWYSLYLYCYSICLEPTVAENFDSNYLLLLKEEMSEKCEQYKIDYDKWKKMLNEYITTAKAFEANKILEVLKAVGNNKIYFNKNLFLGQLLIDVLANAVDKADKKAKKEKKDVAIDSLNLSSIGEDLTAIECKKDELNLFDNLHNGKLEIIKDREDMYIKVLAT